MIEMTNDERRKQETERKEETAKRVIEMTRFIWHPEESRERKENSTDDSWLRLPLATTLLQ
jgi:hypothetical protein